MIDRLLFALAFFSALGSGVMAGLFFAFSAFVMTALGRLAPASVIAAMQSINVTILNPVFFTVFFGTVATSLLLGVAAILKWGEPASLYLLAGSLLYILCSLLVTIFFNVPLNDGIAAVAPDSAEGAATWGHYLAAWMPWNHLRTIGCLAATAAFILALCHQMREFGAG
ncbi:MAG TPA: anthrone oxygenase family protein [Dongiaceae bacterium]|nr:anthrone oxygenase family protein [Dongiaceae bacterium]